MIASATVIPTITAIRTGLLSASTPVDFSPSTPLDFAWALGVGVAVAVAKDASGGADVADGIFEVIIVVATCFSVVQSSRTPVPSRKYASIDWSGIFWLMQADSATVWSDCSDCRHVAEQGFMALKSDGWHDGIACVYTALQAEVRPRSSVLSKDAMV